MKHAVYLDYNATTPIRPAVADLAHEIMATPGNASSVHGFGRAARRHIEIARERVAALAGTQPTQVTFTSGATESNNAVLRLFAGRRIIVSAVEHPAVRNAMDDLEYAPVTSEGIIDLAALQAMLETGAPPALLSIMMVNNETGVTQPLTEIVRMARALHPGILIHTDAVQAAGRIDINFQALNVDYMSLSGHKMGGPQGVGALVSASGAPVARLLHGGGQERRMRAGTENVSGIAGFGLAAMIALEDMPKYAQLANWRERMEKRLLGVAPEARVFGAGAPRVANTTALSMPGASAQTQMMSLDLDGFAVSSGSACSSGTFRPSPVLKAMGADDTQASSTLRISTGWATTEDDVDRFTNAWIALYNRLRTPAAATA